MLKRPVFSEKSMQLAKGGWYTFLVDKKARKPEITTALEKAFGVNIVAIKTASFKAQTKQQRSRKGYFTVPAFKKAVVQLKSGQKIGLFETEKAEVETAEASVKEKKSLLKGTKVKIEKSGKNEKEKPALKKTEQQKEV